MSVDRGIRNTVIVLVLIIATVFGLQFWRASQPEVLDREAFKEYNALLFKTPRQITPFEAIDHQGRPFGPEQFVGQWSLVNFGYTHCPDICPTNMLNLSYLVKALEEAGSPVPQIYMAAVDPERDTPEVLTEYLPFFNKDFIGITGTEETMAGLARQLNNLFSKAPSDDEGMYFVDHSDNLAILNEQGHFVGIFRPPHTVENWQKAITALMAQ
jgi:protein SCO1/2